MREYPIRRALLPALMIFAGWLGSATMVAAQEAAAEPATEESAADPAAESAENPEAVEAGLTAARDWLSLIDEGEFEESWYEAGSALQDAVTPEQWEAALQQARGRFGEFGERTLSEARYTTELPGAPAGEYVVVQFRTMAGEQTITETVVPMKQGDDWKVAGYFVQPAE